MTFSKAFVALLVLGACGGQATPAAQSTQTAQTDPQPPTPSDTDRQCHVLSDRIDALQVDTNKVDPKSGEGMQALASLVMKASTDIGAAKVDGAFVPIAHDAAAYLQTMSQKVAQMGAIVTRLSVSVDSMHVDTMSTCVEKPTRAIVLMCKSHPSAECQSVTDAIEAWGKSNKGDKGDSIVAMRQVMALNVTERALKSQLGEVVKCVQPIAKTLDEVERDKKELAAISIDRKPEQDLDARFKTTCGRGLFNK